MTISKFRNFFGGENEILKFSFLLTFPKISTFFLSRKYFPTFVVTDLLYGGLNQIMLWRIKRKGGNFFIKWYKERNHLSYNPETKRCSLCDHEKLAIALYEGNNLMLCGEVEKDSFIVNKIHEISLRIVAASF